MAGEYLNLSFSGDGATAQDLFAAMEQETAAPRSQASISDRGDASYAIPLALPPARLAAALSLQYGAGGPAHSWVARDWSIASGMRIERIVGQAGSQAYGGLGDAYRVSGGGLDGIVFRDDAHAWRYVSTGNVGVALDLDGATWTVRAGGVTTVLEPDGVPLDAIDQLPLADGAPVRWHTARTRDASGNTVSDAWTGNRLDAIRYGGRTDDAGALIDEHLVQVDLAYAAADGTSQRWSAGVLDAIDRSLVAVDVRSSYGASGFTTVARYETRTAMVDGERMLTGVVQVDLATGDELPMATFTYAAWPAEADLGDVVVDPRGPDLVSHSATWIRNSLVPSTSDLVEGLYDTSGDGLADLLAAVETSWSTRWQLWADEGLLSTWQPVADEQPWTDVFDDTLGWRDDLDVTLYAGGSLDHTQTVRCGDDWSRSLAIRRAIDLDSDGFVDLIDTPAEVPDPWVADPYAPGTAWREAIPGSVCDARAETGGPTTWTVHYGTRDGFDPVAIAIDAPVGFPRIGEVPVTKDLGAPPLAGDVIVGQDAIVDLVDLDGDGWQDVVHLVPGDDGGDPQLWVSYHLGARDAGFAEPIDVFAGVSLPEGVLSLEETDQVIDVEEYATRTGLAESAPRIASIAVRRGLRDVNGDGLLDYVDTRELDGKHWRIWYGTGGRDEQGAFFPDKGVAILAPAPRLGVTDEGWPTALMCSTPPDTASSSTSSSAP